MDEVSIVYIFVVLGMFIAFYLGCVISIGSVSLLTLLLIAKAFNRKCDVRRAVRKSYLFPLVSSPVAIAIMLWVTSISGEVYGMWALGCILVVSQMGYLFLLRVLSDHSKDKPRKFFET